MLQILNVENIKKKIIK